MAQLILTAFGDDRSGLVQTLSATISEHGGNWEQSALSELAGTFAGVVLVSVADQNASALTEALTALAGMLTVTVHEASTVPSPAHETLTFTVLGNDRPGIVRDVTSRIAAHALSIDSFESSTREAPMAGGALFEATVTVQVTDHDDRAALLADLEALAGEIHVDVTLP